MELRLAIDNVTCDSALGISFSLFASSSSYVINLFMMVYWGYL